jgi:hypothetical protein
MCAVLSSMDRWARGIDVPLHREELFPVAWEKRGRHRYYYTGRKVRGRVRKCYHGRDEAAALAAAVVREARAERRAAGAAARDLAAHYAAPDRLARALDGACDGFLEAHLLLAGYHRPNYRAWRRRQDDHTIRD